MGCEIVEKIKDIKPVLKSKIRKKAPFGNFQSLQQLQKSWIASQFRQ